MRGLNHRIPPPIVMVAVGAVMATSIWAEPQPALGNGLSWTLAAAFFCVAGLFGPRAVVAFNRAKTTIDPVRIDHPAALVTTGIFRYTRNPMYVSMALLLCAWACFLARPLAALGPVTFIFFITRFQILSEEQALTAHFGPEYVAYSAMVRRWL